MSAVKVVACEVMNPRGLVKLGMDTLDQSGVTICEALRLYTDATVLPNLVHCSHGKDRTGLICILVLMILGIAPEAIEYDYHQTDAARAELLDARIAEVREAGLADDFARTAPPMVMAVRMHLERRYGGLEKYLDSIGFVDEDRIQMRATLLY